MDFIKLLLFFFILVLQYRHFAQIGNQTLILRRSLVFLVEQIIGKLGSQRHRAEKERNGFLDVGALLVMVPAQELDVGEVDFLRIVGRNIFVQGIRNEIILVLIERDVGTVALLAFRSKRLPDSCAGNHILKVACNAECKLLGILHILKLMSEARLVEGVIYFVSQFCIVLIYFVWFLVWMHCHPILGENYLFHFFRFFVIRG